MKTVLYHKKKIVDEDTLIKLSKCTEKDGTHPKNILKTLEHFGINDYITIYNSSVAELSKYLKNGYICIVDWTSPSLLAKIRNAYDCGHYSVIIDVTSKDVVMHDPDLHAEYPETNGIRIINIKKFNTNWVDYEIENGKKIIYKKFFIAIPL